MNKVKFITAQEIISLRQSGHVAFVATGSKRVRVDGFKQYYIVPAQIRLLKELNNGKVN